VAYIELRNLLCKVTTSAGAFLNSARECDRRCSSIKAIPVTNVRSAWSVCPCVLTVK
jgi:hypothetical protein